MTQFSPKRPMNLDGIFTHVEEDFTAFKRPATNRWTAQRDADGSPHTRHGASALTPPMAGPNLYIKDTVNKSHHEPMVTSGYEAPWSQDRDIQFVDTFVGSALYDEAYKLAHDSINVRKKLANKKPGSITEDLWRDCDDIEIRKQQLLLRLHKERYGKEGKVSKSQMLNPSDVISAYFEKGNVLSCGDEGDKDPDDLKKDGK